MSILAPEPKRRPGIFARLAAWLEPIIMTRLVPADKPGGLWRLIFKQPILIYDLGLGWMIGKQILLLETVGRKTGERRKTPLEYTYDPVEGTYFIMAGWGGKTDWYRNARAHPSVRLRVGSRCFDAVAEPVPDEIVARRLMEAVRSNPKSLRMFQRWSDRPLDGSFESHLYAARFFPSLILKKKLE